MRSVSSSRATELPIAADRGKPFVQLVDEPAEATVRRSRPAVYAARLRRGARDRELFGLGAPKRFQQIWRPVSRRRSGEARD